MTPPRPIIPGQTLMITARAIGRTYRFVPSEPIVRLLRYCMVAALVGLDIDVHEFCWMTNHWHIVLTDRAGNISKYINKVHSLISRNLNAMRGTRGCNFEPGYSIQVESDSEAIARACAYTLANPVRANLVAGNRHWKGLHSGRLNYGETIIVAKPKLGMWRTAAAARPRVRKRPINKTRASFRGRGNTPDTVSFALVRPPILVGTHSDAEVRAEIRGRVARIEQEVAQERQLRGAQTAGMKAVRAVRWWDFARKPDELFSSRPRVAASTQRARSAYLLWYRAFVAAYRAARRAWVAGQRDVEFPHGTYLMRERFGVRCAPPP